MQLTDAAKATGKEETEKVKAIKEKARDCTPLPPHLLGQNVFEDLHGDKAALKRAVWIIGKGGGGEM